MTLECHDALDCSGKIILRIKDQQRALSPGAWQQTEMTKILKTSFENVIKKGRGTVSIDKIVDIVVAWQTR